MNNELRPTRPPPLPPSSQPPPSSFPSYALPKPTPPPQLSHPPQFPPQFPPPIQGGVSFPSQPPPPIPRRPTEPPPSHISNIMSNNVYQTPTSTFNPPPLPTRQPQMYNSSNYNSSNFNNSSSSNYSNNIDVVNANPPPLPRRPTQPSYQSTNQYASLPNTINNDVSSVPVRSTTPEIHSDYLNANIITEGNTQYLLLPKEILRYTKVTNQNLPAAPPKSHSEKKPLSLQDILQDGIFLAMEFEYCKCFEILMGMLFDPLASPSTSSSFSAQQSSSSSSFRGDQQAKQQETSSLLTSISRLTSSSSSQEVIYYSLRVVVPSARELQNDQTHIAELQILYHPSSSSSDNHHNTNYHFGKTDMMIRIGLGVGLFTMKVRERLYFFRYSSPLSLFYLIELPVNVSSIEVTKFEEILIEFSYFHRLKTIVEVDDLIHKTADVIQSGGQLIGLGLTKASSFLGTGIKKASSRYASTSTSSAAPPSPTSSSSSLSSSGGGIDKKKLDKADTAANAFVEGSRGVGQGLKKGFNFIGKSGAHIAHKGYSHLSSSNLLTNSKSVEGEGEIDPNQPIVDNDVIDQSSSSSSLTSNLKYDENKKTISGVKKLVVGSVNAGSSIISGAKQGTRTVAMDIRDSSTTIQRSQRGEDAADQTKRCMEIGAKTAIGSAYCIQLYTTETLHCLIYTGLGVASYDSNKAEVLTGHPWYLGWVTKQGSYLHDWSARFAVLRTYSIAFYKNPYDNTPSSYVLIEDIKSVQSEPESITEYKYSFSIQTASELLYFSLDLTKCYTSVLSPVTNTISSLGNSVTSLSTPSLASPVASYSPSRDSTSLSSQSSFTSSVSERVTNMSSPIKMLDGSDWIFDDARLEKEEWEWKNTILSLVRAHQLSVHLQKSI